jgi:murein DD-endopeptidase MepM/ murein hydrolase activator NlpD
VRLVRSPSATAVLLGVVAAVAGVVVAASQGHGVAPRAPVRRTAPPPPQVRIEPVRCTVARRAAELTAQRAQLVAPTRTVKLDAPFRVQPSLGDDHVFPVLDETPTADTFGAPRSDTGWHHGDDLFAARRTPVVAVADGFVFSMGWQRLGGLRLWLRDLSGNEFYYAHLNGYARGLRSGQDVRAGDVIGYVGESGDAEQTPPHLHFEIHPASLLGLGYDGAVDPTRYLGAWPRAKGRALAVPVAVAPCGLRSVATAASR